MGWSLLGTGTISPCTETGPEMHIAVYAVEGVDPVEKVIAAGWDTLVPYRDDLPDEDTP